MYIETLSDFLRSFPEATWLEDRNGLEHWSNGLEEGSEHRSEWFCGECEAIVDSADSDCEECDALAGLE